MSRWVRVQVDILEHPVFSPEPFSEREAWLWLISKAAWKETKHRIGHTVVTVPVGSVFLTLREMQATWRWKSDKRVRSFLSMLEREEMIETKTDAGKTQVSICNYSRYQDAERTEDASRTQAGRTADALKTPEHQYTNTSSLRSEDKTAPKALSDIAAFKADLEQDATPEQVEAFAKHRKAKRGQNSAYSAKLFRRDAAECGLSISEAIDTAISRGWLTVKPEYLGSRNAQTQHRSASPPRNDLDRMNAALDNLISGAPDEPYEPHQRTIDASFERRDSGSSQGVIQFPAVSARY